jgi:hypothetical protein
LAVAVSAACENPSLDETSVENQEQAVWARDADGEPIASNDASSDPSADKFRNVVVRIPTKNLPAGKSDTGCTGVLLTPSLVLTSKHCISDGKGTGSPDVQIGSQQTGFTKRRVLSVAQMPAAPSVAGLDAGDLVLLKLALPTTAAEAYLVPSLRPTLAAPALSAGVAVPAPPGGNRELPKIEMVGWSPFAIDDNGQTVAPTYAVQNRQSVSIPNAYLNWLTADGIAPFFVREVYAPLRPGTAQSGLHSGDVGSPLYFFDTPSATNRKLIGLATAIGMASTPADDGTIISERPAPTSIPGTNCELSRCDVWADLTTPQVKSFIEGNVAMSVGRRWLRFHPRKDGLPNYWYGESDVETPLCSPGSVADDLDCDGWLSTNKSLPYSDFFAQRDNCPDKFNPDQADSDDDGYGDLCDTCNNPGNTDCDSRADPLDNCPTVANEGFSDADADGIGDACDRCSDVIDNGMESQTCAASCQSNAILGNNSIGSALTGSEYYKISPAGYGSRNCDGRWIFEFTPAQIPFYGVTSLNARMERQDWQTAGLQQSEASKINPRALCEGSQMSGELWLRRKDNKQWERLYAGSTGFTWRNVPCAPGDLFCQGLCPPNVMCPEHCSQNSPVAFGDRLDLKAPTSTYDLVRFVGSLSVKRQTKTDVVNAYGPMQGMLWNNQPPR